MEAASAGVASTWILFLFFSDVSAHADGERRGAGSDSEGRVGRVSARRILRKPQETATVLGDRRRHAPRLCCPPGQAGSPLAHTTITGSPHHYYCAVHLDKLDRDGRARSAARQRANAARKLGASRSGGRRDLDLHGAAALPLHTARKRRLVAYGLYSYGPYSYGLYSYGLTAPARAA